MKTAKEMLEELGYKKGDFCGMGMFATNIDDLGWRNYIQFIFDEKDKEVIFRNNFSTQFSITFDEFKAIAKYIEEKGW